MASKEDYGQILIVEFGSQYTMPIERSLRDMGYRSIILPVQKAAAWLAQRPVKCVILSGGPSSVTDEDAPQPPEGLFPFDGGMPKVPVLGICYGMQWIAQHYGGSVEAGTPEYGLAHITTEDVMLFEHLPKVPQQVWASHGDSVRRMPPGFEVIATDIERGVLAGIKSDDGRVWCVQFHPEVSHTPYGPQMLVNFVKSAGCTPDWKPQELIGTIGEDIARQVGPRGVAVMGMSGGVDSTTLGTIAARSLGSRLHALCINGGQFRKDELDVVRSHAQAGEIPLVIEDSQEAFFEALAGITDAQAKRKAFQPPYVQEFKDAAGAVPGERKFLLQGTLAPDRIESGATGGDVIKTHHNVGLNTGALIQLHPFQNLFKYEVRALARELGLPESVWARQPFPGPGLFLRYLHAGITSEGIEIVRWGDAKATEIAKHHGIYDKLSQFIVAYDASPLVGVKGDKRTYAGGFKVRAVQTIDFMTAEGYAFLPDFQKEVSRELTRHPAAVHVGFYPTDKPPGTTEFE